MPSLGRGQRNNSGTGIPGRFYLYRIALDEGGAVRSLLSHTDEYEVGARVLARVRCGHSLRPFLDGVALAD